jgi:hypothetical protein
MRKRLQIALMASTVAATSFFLTPQLRAEDGNTPSEKITATDEHGRTVYVNESVPVSPAHHSQESESPRRALMYWSSKENRWKPVPRRMRRPCERRGRRRRKSTSIWGMNPASRQLPRLWPPISADRGNGGDIDSAIEQAAARHNVDPNLVRAVVKVESNFNPNAVSRKGAMGLMQLMPSTARQLKVKNPFDPEQNVDAGVRHLKQLLESYGGDVKLTLAAYNAGAGAVARSSGVPHYAETQNYVRRITNLYYGGSDFNSGSVSHDPVRVQRDARGVLYISNTD